MIEFLFGVAVGILLVYLFFELRANGTIADKLVLTVAGYILTLKKVDDEAKNDRQQSQRTVKSLSASIAEKAATSASLRSRFTSSLAAQSPREQPKIADVKSPRGSANLPPTTGNNEFDTTTARSSSQADLGGVPNAVQSPREQAPKSPKVVSAGSSRGKPPPSLYLNPTMGKDEFDFATARSSSQADLGGAPNAVQSPREQVPKSPKVTGPSRGKATSSVYLTPTMGKDEFDVATARSSSQADLGGASKSPSAANTNSEHVTPSVYLTPKMTQNRSKQLDVDTARSSSRTDLRR